MLINRFRDRYLPCYAPDDGTGGAGGAAPGADAGAVGADTGADAGADVAGGPSTLRQQIDKTVEDLRKEPVAADDGKRDKKGRYESAARREGITGDGAAAAGTGADAGAAAAAAAAAAEMPKAFGGELAPSWGTVPPAWQQAIAKREADMERGVQELKGRYNEIDRAIEPHMQEIRKHGKSAGQAVEQLFAWFQALGSQPESAFPALAKSFNFDLAKLGVGAAGAPGAGAAAAAAGGAQPGADIPPAVQQYIDGMKQELQATRQQLQEQLGGLTANFQRETQAKTEEALQHWSKDKPHFEAVRGTMAQLIQSGIVPPKDGKVDLDGAYERAMWTIPEVRAKVLADQEAAKAKAAADKANAEKTAQQTAADRARKAGVSLTGGAPGAPSTQQQGKTRGKGKSVRESLQEAISQVND